ncbi:helix-turn-helix domain-containing protein [Streptomyces mexicanus]|uniref:helix-turn-helix domain-containing protein n=1 Tax=Streptomyces mexicanus TaxID=178566 RepID=UPI0031ED1B8A
MSNRPLLTQQEAADACGVSRTTIRRRREAGELPGSVLDEKRGWLIPVEALLAAGFRLHAPAPPDKAGPGETTARAGQSASLDEAAELRAEIERLRTEMAEERHARAMAQAEAEHLKERLRERSDHIADLQRALAALTPAPERAAIPQPTAPTAAPAVPVPAPAAQETTGARTNGQEQRRRWWSRRG